MTVDNYRLPAQIHRLMHCLLDRGSWCGETHLQKAAYFAQAAAGVDLGVGFTLYKFGPFSFDLRDAIARMRSQGFITLQPQPPYGPGLRPSHASEWLTRVGLVTAEEIVRFGIVADFVGDKNVMELERLATALYATRMLPMRGGGAQANYINAVKPHVSIEDATAAIQTVHQFEASAQSHLEQLGFS